jgi:hypothetical protein
VANWSQFTTPIVAFAIALLAGIGVQILLDVSLHRRAFVYALGGLALTLTVCALMTAQPLAFGQAVSLLGGWPLALAVAALIGSAISSLHRVELLLSLS